MALPTSGTITWEMIRAEFGGTYPIYINQYYRGGPLVPNVPANNGIPTSGAISAFQFRGATKVTPFAASIDPSSVYQYYNRNDFGTLYASAVISMSGGSGSYTVTNLDGTTPTTGVTYTRSGNNVSLTATGQNTSRNGIIRFRCSDGATNIDVSLWFQFDFGVLA